jgi:hypothetical protein
MLLTASLPGISGHELMVAPRYPSERRKQVSEWFIVFGMEIPALFAYDI